MPAPSRFLAGFAGGGLGLIVGLVALFLVLDHWHALKAPALSNNASFDEKMRVLRERPPGNVGLLLVGSSTTLHGVDGDALRAGLREDVDILNVGVQSITIDQSRFLTDFFLDRLPSVESVVMISTMLDFRECVPEKTAFFDPSKVAGYLSRHTPELYFHFKYFDLTGVLKQAPRMARLREADDVLNAVSFDEDGSLLLDVPRRNLPGLVWRGEPIALDAACYEALRAMALELRGVGLPFTYFIAPMRPGYLDGRDPGGRLLAEHRRRLYAALSGTGAALVDAHGMLAMPEGAFFDAYHLKPDEVPALSRLIAEALNGARDEYTVTGPTAPETARSPRRRPVLRPLAADLDRG